jgi:hypothetical protein
MRQAESGIHCGGRQQHRREQLADASALPSFSLALPVTHRWSNVFAALCVRHDYGLVGLDIPN